MIKLLTKKFQDKGISVINGSDDADTLIVQTAIRKSALSDVTVIGRDTDLLALLWHYVQKNDNNVYFQSPQRKWHVNKLIQEVLLLLISFTLAKI